MKRENQDLKKLYQYSLDHNRTPDKECPDTDMIIQSFSSDLSESEKYRVVDHISECSSCRQKFAIVRQVFSKGKKMAAALEGMSLSEEETSELKAIAKARIDELERSKYSGIKIPPKPDSTFPFWRKTAFKYASAFAGLIVILVVAFALLKAPPVALEDSVRGIQDDVIRLKNPRGSLESIPRTFEWNPVPGAVGYQFVLLDDQLIEVWRSGKTRQTSVELPQSYSEAIKSAKIYYWKVIVVSSDGSARESGLQEFEIKINR
jgi:hypothetical protein